MTNLAIHALATAVSMTMFAAPAAANTIIDFASYAEGTVYDQPITIGEATFSSSSGLLKIVDLGGGNSLCAFDGAGCNEALTVEFTPGVSRLTFNFSGDVGDQSRVRWEGETNALAFFGQVRGDGNPATVQSQFIRFEELRSLSLIPTDSNGGIAFNSFSYTSAAVPEPATWAMMLFGFGAVGVAMRRGREAIVREARTT